MWLALASSALLFFFSYGLGEFWPLAWIAPVPVWIYCWRERKQTWIAGVAYLLGSANMLVYYLDVMPAIIAIAALLLTAILFWKLTQYTARFVENSGWMAAPFAFPSLWAAIEWIRSQLSPHGTAGNLADAQTDFLPALQIVSVTGSAGLTFLLLLVPSALACYWITRRARVLAAPAALFAITILYGGIRLRTPTPPGQAAVAAVATDGKDTSVEDYAKRASALAAQGAKFILLPEKFATIEASGRDRAYRILGEAAARGQATVIAGLTLTEGSKRRNVAVVFGPRGETLGTYDKQHMVPGWESDLTPGNRTLVIDNYGVAICKDFDFPSLTAQYAEQGVGIMFAPAWDFTRDAKLHRSMAVMRAVEHGFTLVRAARQGRVTVADPYGRILAEASTLDSPEASAVVRNAPAQQIVTPYAKFGDWFGVLCCVAAGWFAFRASRRVS